MLLHNISVKCHAHSAVSALTSIDSSLNGCHKKPDRTQRERHTKRERGKAERCTFAVNVK